MRSSRRSAVLFGAAAVLLLSAGMVTGMLVSRLQAAAPAHAPFAASASSSGGGSSPLIEALDLTPMQREQMRQIWDGVHDDVQSGYRDAQRIQKRREEVLLSLLNDQQRAEFDKITREYARQYAAVVAQRERAFETAVTRTRQLLSAEQRKTYNTILQNRLGHMPAPASTEPFAGPASGG